MKYFAVTAAFSISSILACSPGPIRKEWRELSSSQQTAFIAAVNKLNQRKDNTDDDSTDPKTWSYAHFAIVHARYQLPNHNQGKTESPPFFPWHRIFLHYYEMALQSIDPSITLPYWDFSQDSQKPLASAVFAQNAFGGVYQPNTGCIIGGSFSGWQSAVNGGCLKRCPDPTAVLYSSAATVGYINNSPTFSSFNWQIQNSPHAAVHSNIGGHCGDGSVGDLFTMSSAGDPIFYMLHGMIDKIWMLWQDQCPSKFAKAYDGQLNAPLVPFKETPQDILNYKPHQGSLCYSYSKSSINVPNLTQSCSNGAPNPTSTVNSKPSASAVPESDGPVEDYFVELRVLDLLPGSAQILQKAFPGFSNDKINTIPNFMHRTPSKLKSNINRRGQLQPNQSDAPSTLTMSSVATPTDYPVQTENTTVPVIPDVLPVYKLNSNYTVAAPLASDSENLYKLRHPSPISEKYMQMMNLPTDQTRYFEYLGKLFTDDANNIPGYIPPSALVNFYKYNSS
ncbi:hypothetical protein HDV06_006421 [Boothiomyces sp. JEL0866]|nr:hypothetical protein HDV06_006421 [Boothiomyces sp. JEL0866]